MFSEQCKGVASPFYADRLLLSSQATTVTNVFFETKEKSLIEQRLVTIIAHVVELHVFFSQWLDKELHTIDIVCH